MKYLMKKATACLLAVALVVGLLPTMALAAAYTVVSNETLKIENWDQYNGKSIALNDGSTLDLSGVNSNPSSDVHVQIYGGTVTIKGNPNFEFNSYLRIEVYGTAETGSTTIKLENFRRTDNAVLLFFQSGVSDDNITIEYSGTNKAGSTDSSDGRDYSLGLSYMDNVTLTLKGAEGATLDLRGGILILGSSVGAIDGCSLTLDGGTVNCGTIRQRYYTGDASITVKNGCKLQCDEISLLDGGTGSNGTITIDDSDVTVNSENRPSSLNGSIDNQWGDYTGIGGIFGGQKIEIKNQSTVTAYSHSSPNALSGTYVYASPAIGNAESIIISDSEVTATAKYWGSDKRGGNSSGIGGGFNSIQITDSTINATGYFGAGIGSGGAINNDTHFSDNKTISIADSDVESVSTYGAGIGAGYTTNYASNIDITISGNSDITAVSQSGAGIGSGALGNVYLSPGLAPLIIGRADIKNWSDTDDQEVEAGMNSLFLDFNSLTAALAAYDASSSLGTINGTLTISANANSETPTIQAESGVKAVNMTVSAGQPMMEYTLGNETDVPDTATPINRDYAEMSGTDNGPGAPSYTLRPDFRSLAFWPVAAGDYTLSYGSGDNPDPLLDATDSAPDYADTYTLTPPAENGNALQSFTVVRAQKLSGTVKLTDGSGVEIDGAAATSTTLHLDLSGVTPTGVTSGGNVYLTYQWYKDGQPISGAIANTYTPTETGVYYCAVTGTDRFWGTLNSEAVTVVESGTAPTAPTVANTDTQITDDSITLDMPSDGNTYEYALVNGDSYTWQSSATFNGLDRNTTYSFVQRVAAQDDGEPGQTSAAASFTTKLGRPSEDDLHIDYATETFTVTTGVSLYTDPSCTNKITVDANASITDYIGTTLYAKYDDETTAELGVNVTAIDVPQRPTAPTFVDGMVTAAENSLTISGVSGVTYAIFNRYNTVNPIETITCTADNESIIFDELASNTQYVLKARYEATNSSFKSLQARIDVSTTAIGSLATISVTPVANGNTFPYDGSSHAFQYTTDPESVTGFTVKYYQETDKENATTDTPTNVGTYNVIVTREADETYAAYEQIFQNCLVITQGTQTAPAAPTMASRTTTTITLSTITTTSHGAVEYGFVTAGGSAESISNWQTSTVFTGLNSGTTYTFYARYAESADKNYAASPTSVGTQIATLPAAPAAGTVTINYADETLTFISNYEVSTDANFTTTIASGESISNIIPAYGESAKTLYVRVKANGNIPASEAMEFTIPARPSAPNVSGGIRQISGLDATMEYSQDGTTWTKLAASDLENGVLSNLEPGTYLVRYAAVTGESPAFASEIMRVTVTQPSSGGGATTYPPVIEEGGNGSVSVTPSRPSSGQIVTIRPDPDPGFEVDEVIVTDQNGKEIDVTDNQDGSYSFRQPTGSVTITVTFRCDGGELCPSYHLTDITKGEWYHEAVDYVVKHDIMSGTSDTTFEPGTELTRAMAVQILYNLEGQPDISDEILGYPYSDVNAQEWYANAVYWARITGVATGYGDGTFHPTDSITRQEFAQILYNYAVYKGYDLTARGDLSQFPDSNTIANWAETAMSWANGEGLINGHNDGTIDATGTTIRAQAASILMRFDQNLIES